MHILHLIDNQPNTTLSLLAQSLDRLGSTRQQVLLLGGQQLARAAQRAGIHYSTRTGAADGLGFLAWPRMRRIAQTPEGFDAIHCWSISAFALAILAWPGIPRLLTLTTTPSKRSVRWLKAIMSDRSSKNTILATSSTIRRDLLTHGIPEQKTHVLRPGIDMGLVQHGARQDLRRGWGIDSDDTRVIALLSDPAYAADALHAGMVLELADYSPNHLRPTPRLRLLVHPAQHNRLRAKHAAQNTRHSGRIIQEPGIAEPWSVLPGCDIAMAMGPHAGGLSLIWAMAANIPIIGEATYAISEIVEDRHSALLATPNSAKHLARRVCQVMDDQHLAWQLRDTARHEAYSFFSRQHYCRSLATVYEQAASCQPIQVPELEATGGLRFAGRA